MMTIRCLLRSGFALTALALLVRAAPAVAADVNIVHRLSANLAAEATTAAVAACAQGGFSASAVLLDSDGLRIAVLRGDSAPPFTLQLAHDKAYTAVSARVDSGVLVERQKAGTLALVYVRPGSRFLIAQGAVLLKIGDEIVGALGVSGAPGGDKDEACALAGIAKIRNRLK